MCIDTGDNTDPERRCIVYVYYKGGEVKTQHGRDLNSVWGCYWARAGCDFCPGPNA